MVHASLVTFPLGFKETAAGGASWDGVLGSDLCFPGCLSLTGPGSVAGTTGSSVRVRCQYEKAYKGHNKYWCRGKYGRVCRKIVETEGEEKEKRNGRVSIRDHADNLTFTVTMENLNMNDAGSYWCRIQTIWILDVLSWDPSAQVEVSVFPGKSSLWSSSRAYGKRVGLWTKMGDEDEQCPASCPLSQQCWEEPRVCSGRKAADPSALAWAGGHRYPTQGTILALTERQRPLNTLTRFGRKWWSLDDSV